jgi:hypothetical protein
MYGYTYGYPSGGGAGAVNGFESAVLSDGGTVVAIGNTTDLYSRLLGLGLINSASLVNSCNGGKADALYNFVPSPVQALDRFVVTRASTKLRIGSNGLYGSVANNVPAFEFNTDGSYRGLLVEPGATNLNPYSIDIRSSGEGAPSSTWTANDTLVLSTNNLAPDGALTATRIRGNGATNRARQMSITGTSGAPYTGSFFIRRVSGATTGTINVRVGDVGQVATVNPTTTWQRFSHTASPTSTTVRLALVFPNDTDEFDVWQAQLETGSVATSPIVTTAGTASRVADVVSLTGASSLIGQQEGSVYAEVNITNYGGATDSIFTISDGTINNRIEVNKRSGATLALERASTTQSGATTISSGVMGLGVMRIAIAYKTGDTVLFINGVQIGSTALQTFTMSAIDRIFLGSNATGGTRYWNSNIRALAVFPTRLANATLASITA